MSFDRYFLISISFLPIMLTNITSSPSMVSPDTIPRESSQAPQKETFIQPQIRPQLREIVFNHYAAGRYHCTKQVTNTVIKYSEQVEGVSISNDGKIITITYVNEKTFICDLSRETTTKIDTHLSETFFYDEEAKHSKSHIFVHMCDNKLHLYNRLTTVKMFVINPEQRIHIPHILLHTQFSHGGRYILVIIATQEKGLRLYAINTTPVGPPVSMQQNILHKLVPEQRVLRQFFNKEQNCLHITTATSEHYDRIVLNESGTHCAAVSNCKVTIFDLGGKLPYDSMQPWTLTH
jgi:hypothetical protein